MAERTENRWVPQNLANWQRTPSPQRRWLLRNLVPRAAIGIVSGPRKVAFKTWTASLMAQSLASGASYGDIIVPAEPGVVLFDEEEGGRVDTQSRQRKIQLGCFGHDIWASDPYDGRFLWFHHLMLKLDDPRHTKQILKIVEAKKVSLVILDAVTYMHRGDENSKKDMQPVIEAVSAIRALGATVMMLMHTSKQSQREDADFDLDVRGHSVFLDLYDFHFALRRHKDTDALFMACRYRDHRDKKFTLWWDIEECDDDDGHDHDGNKNCAERRCKHLCETVRCDHAAKLTITRRGEETSLVEIFEQRFAGVLVGTPHTWQDFQVALGKGYSASEANDIYKAMKKAGLIQATPSGKGFIIPGRH